MRVITVLLLSIHFSGFAQQISWLQNLNYSIYGCPVYTMISDGQKNIYTAGGYYIPYYNGYYEGFYLQKNDSLGNLIWCDTIPSTGGADYFSVSLKSNFLFVSGSGSRKITFGNFVLDYLYHRGVMAKYDLNGNVIWAKQDTLLTFDNIQYVGNFLYATGFSSGNGQYFIAAYDNGGNQQWIRYFNSEIKDFSVLSNNELLLKKGNGASYDPDSVRKYDTNGNLLWARAIDHFGYGFTVDRWGNCYLSGDILNTDNYLQKIDPDGNVLWTRYGYMHGLGYIKADAENSNLYVGGNDVNNSAWFGVYDSLGNLLSEVQIGNYRINDITRSGTDYYIGGKKTGQYPVGFVAKISDPVMTGSHEQLTCGVLEVFPNPGSGIFQVNYSTSQKGNLTLNVINSKGQKVYSEKIQDVKGELRKTIDLSKEAKGIYFVEIVSARGKEVKKILIE